MTISDDELARYAETSGMLPPGITREICTELRDARRKLAAVEAEVGKLRTGLMLADKSRSILNKSQVRGPLDRMANALAAGEAPTEPATKAGTRNDGRISLVQSRCPHGRTHSHPWNPEGVYRTDPPRLCPGPVPQGGTE